MKRTITKEYDAEGRLVKEVVVEEDAPPVLPNASGGNPATVLPLVAPYVMPVNHCRSTSGEAA